MSSPENQAEQSDATFTPAIVLPKAESVRTGERAPIIQQYLRENAWVTKREFGVDPKAPINEFEAIADKHPVFKITPRS